VLPQTLFQIPEKKIHVCLNLLRNKDYCHILLYGEPGTGKTEFVRWLADKSNLPLFWAKIDNDDYYRSRVSEDIEILQVANGIAKNSNGILVVDEADRFFNNGISSWFSFLGNVKGKAKVNSLLDTLKGKIIWIINYKQSADASNLRRIDYSLRFKAYTKQMREKVWKYYLQESNIFRYLPYSEIAQTLSEIKVNPSGISNAVRNAEQLVQTKKINPGLKKNQNFMQDILMDVLEEYIHLVHGTSLRVKNMVPEEYDSKALNTDVPLDRIEVFLKNFIMQKVSDRQFGVNLLFWGVPGTGKTQCAHYLARKLDYELVVKKASDILSPWVGATERLINAAFAEAEREEKILLIDEVDSLLQSRNRAIRSWEITQVNEMLTQLENHRTIVILTTNYLKLLDSAVLRRVQFKVHFQPLTLSQKILLYNKYFAKFCGTFPEEKKAELVFLSPLTAGDFKTVWLRLASIGNLLTHDLIMQELEREIKYKENY
ncbi:MAG: AAA family ATPase, partial [Bacteroidetes bacterium]